MAVAVRRDEAHVLHAAGIAEARAAAARHKVASCGGYARQGDVRISVTSPLAALLLRRAPSERATKWPQAGDGHGFQPSRAAVAFSATVAGGSRCAAGSAANWAQVRPTCQGTTHIAHTPRLQLGHL